MTCKPTPPECVTCKDTGIGWAIARTYKGMLVCASHELLIREAEYEHPEFTFVRECPRTAEKDSDVNGG